MKIYGLTGQSGVGKGTVAKIFSKYSIPSVDTDAVYHEILEEGGDCTEELVRAFGTKILNSFGKVDRHVLAQVVFGKKDTPALLHTLNEITHKYIMSETKKRLAQFKAAGAPAALVDAPLLFEAKIDEWCDLVIGVIAERKICMSRIVARDHITEEAALRRINAQRDAEFFRSHCQVVLENNGDTDGLEQQILAFLAAQKEG